MRVCDISFRLALALAIALWLRTSVVPVEAQGNPRAPDRAADRQQRLQGRAVAQPGERRAAPMARTLRELGFTVLAHENATKRAMETAIIAFGRRLAGGGVGFFYYAGHGLQVRGRNYLVPIDAEIDSRP